MKRLALIVPLVLLAGCFDNVRSSLDEVRSTQSQIGEMLREYSQDVNAIAEARDDAASRDVAAKVDRLADAFDASSSSASEVFDSVETLADEIETLAAAGVDLGTVIGTGGGGLGALMAGALGVMLRRDQKRRGQAEAELAVVKAKNGG